MLTSTLCDVEEAGPVGDRWKSDAGFLPGYRELHPGYDVSAVSPDTVIYICAKVENVRFLNNRYYALPIIELFTPLNEQRKSHPGQ